MKRFRGGLVFKAQTFVSLNSRLESNNEEKKVEGDMHGFGTLYDKCVNPDPYRGISLIRKRPPP